MKTSKFQAIASVLRSEIPQSDIQKSSHWQHYTNERTLNRDGTVSGISGFGGRARRTWLHQKVHDHLQRRVLGKNHPVFEGPAYREASNYTKTQGRALDMDCLRHACTLDLLRAHHQKMSSPRNVTVIGDGQTNFLAAALVIRPLFHRTPKRFRFWPYFLAYFFHICWKQIKSPDKTVEINSRVNGCWKIRQS